MPKSLTIGAIPDDFYATAVNALCERGNCQSEDAAEREAFAADQLKREIGRIVADYARGLAQAQAQAAVDAADAQIAATHDAVDKVVTVEVA